MHYRYGTCVLIQRPTTTSGRGVYGLIYQPKLSRRGLQGRILGVVDAAILGGQGWWCHRDSPLWASPRQPFFVDRSIRLSTVDILPFVIEENDTREADGP